MKIIKWLWKNILFVSTLFLLAFIPLYPKRPILDIVNTWVYIRAEDFVVVSVLIIWLVLLLRKKITLRTPLTLPILIFWIIGAIATIHGVLLIFPETANLFPNIAFLSMLRRIEYMSLFFVAYMGVKDKKVLPYIIAVLAVTLVAIVGYGIGQKYFEFPAYLTMNEEFAKGEPIKLSALSRVPSTFGGHYDLAAYLVLVIPIFTSLIFGLRNWFLRILLAGVVSSGFVLLFMTVSRVSFFVLLISLLIVLFFQKKKLLLLSLPVIAIATVFLLSFTPALLQRFGNTVKEIDVLVDAETGEAIGHVERIPSTHFEDKIIKKKVFHDKDQLNSVITEQENPQELASPSAFFLHPSLLPPEVVLIAPPNVSTGENLPQGTGYINLSLSPVTKRVGEFYFDKPDRPEAIASADAFVFSGNFLIKRASAYDLSFTTRFQGEWPNAIEAFKRNILFGSGYSSVSLAVDNNYLRILGEIGLLGFASFISIFIIIGIYIWKVLPHVDSPLVKSFAVGFLAGLIGLALNAVLIDVFEASKVAFSLWLLTGVTLGTLHFYQTKEVNVYKELKQIATSTYAIIIYLLLAAIIVFSPMIGNYFVGDDFTWFRWAAQCSDGINCLTRYFTETDGFFYRPATKAYFFLMYSVFWLNQVVYHIVSIALHFIVSILFFLVAKKILRDTTLSAVASFLFLILSGYSETVFWISATGHLFNAMFILLGLFFFILWEERKKGIYFIGTLLSIALGLLFHELGVVTPLLFIAYKSVHEGKFTLKIFKKIEYLLLFVPLVAYLILRFVAHSHWFSGDYSYNLLKLPFNVLGNAIGYIFLTYVGPASLPFYTMLRNLSREHMLIALLITAGATCVFFFAYRMITNKMEKEEKRIIIFSLLFSFICLLPFLGLGNIASRYSYLAAFGPIILLVFSIKKLYGYLKDQGRDVALAGIGMLITLLCLLHIIQIQQIHNDWHEAGKKVEKFLIAIEGKYADHWATERMEFHFVNVPIRVGEAWVFPVGLEDALWLTLRNPDIHIYKWESVQKALDAVDGSPNKKVFEFDSSGGIVEYRKFLDVR